MRLLRTLATITVIHVPRGVQTYSWDSPGLLWFNLYTVFCGPFYDRLTLGDLMTKYASNKNQQKVMENVRLLLA